MRLTARGSVAVGIVLLSVGLGWAFGARSLNAVAAPLLAALVVGIIAIWRADPPTVEYRGIEPGHPGESRTLTFTVEGGGMASIRQSLPAGLSGTPVDAVVALPHRFERSVALDQRGRYDLDPLEIRQRDPLGLVERRAAVETGPEFVVYPRTYSLADPTLSGLLAERAVAERQEFDRLREYTPGDPLRNVHWKSSAKRDEFLVVEFDPSESTATVTIAAEAEPGRADEMAAATATVALAALEAGLSVRVTVPAGSQQCELGESRDPLLGLLARTGAGEVRAQVREEADVFVVAGARGISIQHPNGDRRFESLIAGRRERPQGVSA